MNGIAELYRLRLAETIAAGDTTPMMVFPIGEWHSALYPDLPLTEDLASEMIANFESGILGTEPVVDSSGKHDTSAPAAGWVKRVYLASYEEEDVTGLALWADVKWTGLGAAMLSDDQYMYGSVEIGPVVTNAAGDQVENVLRSLTLTNTPVLRIMPGVKNAAEKQRTVVTLSLSEVTLADAPVDPVQSILDDMDALAAKADASMKGKKGMPDMRAMMRQARAKVSAHKASSLAEAGSTNDQREALEQALSDAFGAMHEGLYVEDFGPDWVVFHTWSAGASEGHYYRVTYSGTTFGQPVEVERDTTYVPVTDSSPAGAQPASSTALSPDAKATEGQGAHLAEGDAAQKGVDHHMDIKTLTILKLAEGASDEAVDAAVSALSERVTTAETALSERDKAERKRDFEAKLAEAMKPDEKQVVHVLPGQKDMFLSLAEKDHDGALAFLDEAMKGTGFQLGAVGTGTEGDDKPTKRADVELSELTQARMAKDGIDYPKAMALTLSENPNEIRERYQNFLDGKEA